jgi:hypothetical protein
MAGIKRAKAGESKPKLVSREGAKIANRNNDESFFVFSRLRASHVLLEGWSPEQPWRGTESAPYPSIRTLSF